MSHIPGFGSTQNNAFGAKPGGFGSTTTTSSGGIFGGGTATAGTSGFGGGFGSGGATSTPFGQTSTGGGLFGASKPAFGATNTTSSPFGGNTTQSPFGGSSGGFGAPGTTLGTNTAECTGTGSSPFQPFIEKEPNSTSNQQNAFQTISFQPPYQKFSQEELRLADYAQGRKYGNASNQPGAFGTSTGFGSFGGSQNTGGFGATNQQQTGGIFGSGATSSPFGTSQPSTGFGASTATSGGLFGNKPAAGGLFGAQTQAQPSSGLFGSAAPSTGFGNNTNTGGFGQNPNANQGSSIFGGAASKPAFSFNNAQPAATNTGFGSSNTGTGFGSGGGGLFGNAQQQQNTSIPFGQPQQQQPSNASPFGGFGNQNQQQSGASSIFGQNNQQKPGGLFGSTANTGTGLFGSTQPSANTSNPFGASVNTQNAGGGLFGAPKPATGGGLFGQTNTQNNTGGSSMFAGLGQNQNQQQQNTGSIFSSLNNNQNQPKPSMFAQPQQQTGTSLFGGNNSTQQQGGGLFGSLNNQNQQQQPQNSLFGGSSILGTSQQNNQTPQSLTTSISDQGAFGTPSLFANLASSQISNPGPIATPLASSLRQKKAIALPMYKLNSASSSRFATPQRRGYGFSYSAYSTPGSATSTASTPGLLSSGFLGGSRALTLGKSVSTSNLRRTFDADEGILAPGVFSASPGARQYGSTKSLRTLNISRNIRNDLFTPPAPSPPQPSPSQSILKKKSVTFDASTVPAAEGANGARITNGSTSPSKQQTQDRSALAKPATNGARANASKSPEMVQVRGNELAIVPENEVAEPQTHDDSEEIKSGVYYMRPSRAKIEAMPRAQRQQVTTFTVGRGGVGLVQFDKPVDLTTVNLDDICGRIVVLEVRQATVYLDAATKPLEGHGLNVPSTIQLENVMPRHKGKSKDVLKKHIEKLKKVPNTEFEAFNTETGTWTFKVPHFTTYGFDEDDERQDMLDQLDQSTLSAPPDTPTPSSRSKAYQSEQSFMSTSAASRTESDPEDTFEFKKKKKVLPGAFDDQEIFEDEPMKDDQTQESFLDDRSVGSQSDGGVDEPMDHDESYEIDESVSIVDQEMAGSYPEPGNTTELVLRSQVEEDEARGKDTPGAIMRARMRAKKSAATPQKPDFAADDDWANTLMKTVSPQKQDRALLKSLIDVHGDEARFEPELSNAVAMASKRNVSDGRGFATSIDLMNSLFGQAKSPEKTRKAQGFEVCVPCA